MVLIFYSAYMIRFIPYQSTRLYQPDSNSPAGAGYFAYFLWKQPEQLPQEIFISDSWDKYIGFYLFLKEAPTENNMQDFITKVTDELKDANAQHTGFLWIEYLNITQYFKVVSKVTTDPGEKVLLAQDMQFDFRNYSLPLKYLAPVQIKEEGKGNITAFTFEYPAYPDAPKPRQAFDIQLPLTGAARGTIQGQVSLGDLSANEATGWNASLYYVIHYNEEDIAQQYPIFNLQEAGLQVLFDYNLDPVDPQNAKRTYLAFTGKSFVLKQVDGKWVIEDYSASNQMPTYFRTVYGNKIELIPITTGDHPARLVFEALPPVDGKQRYYFAPSGDFEMVVSGQEKLVPAVSFQMTGGLSGAESISFTSKSLNTAGDILRFEAGRPAYAPVFPIIEKKKNAENAASVPQHKQAAIAQQSFSTELRRHFTSKALNALQHPRGLDTKVQGAVNKLLTDDYKTSWLTVIANTAKPAPQQPATRKPGGLGKPLKKEHLPDIENWEDLAEVMENEKRVELLQQQVPVYYSQPNDAALYNHDKLPVNVGNFLLQLRDTPAAYLTGANAQFLPMVPYAGAGANLKFSYNDVRDFELQVLGPSRRMEVSSIPFSDQKSALPLDNSGVLTTTPQGLLAKVPESGLTWQSVQLAKSESKGVIYSLEFGAEVTKELRDAMQSNQLFLVATEAAPLGNFLNKITIADWPFTIRAGKGSDTGSFSNILIFKFASGTLEERIKDSKSWSSASVFNENPILVSRWISAYIESAKLNAQNNYRFKNFVEIVQNPAWSGILALQVDIGVDTFPEDLKGLLAGIDRDQFFAHHFGIEVNFVKPDEQTGELKLPKSSLFGLINYVDRSYGSNEATRSHLDDPPFLFSVQEATSPIADNSKPLYDFKVLTLQVVFANSDIQDFTSRIQLTTTQWFGEAAQLNTNSQGDSLNQQSIEFKGSYEKHNGVRTYTFVTDPGQVYRFMMQSQTMHYVEIVKAQFNTLQSPKPGFESAGEAGKESIFSRFNFWGYMNFKLIKSFDLYSFGDLTDELSEEAKGLYFANLAVEMNFELDQQTGIVTNRAFSFVPDRMSFDMSLSTPRNNSLFNNFPIRLSSIVHSKEEKAKPSDQGFLPVIIQSPTQVNAQALTDNWYALLYDLNLGSMGALAAKAGFVSQVSTAWSPDAAAQRLSVGVKLPGVGGGQKTLSLQSVLNINIQSFTFISEYADANNELLAYLLRFNNVKLSILGKKIPGDADTQFILFGDYNGVDKTTLAWYAAYYRKTTPLVPIKNI